MLCNVISSEYHWSLSRKQFSSLQFTSRIPKSLSQCIWFLLAWIPISLSLSLCAVKDSASHTCKQTYYSVAFPFLVRDCFCHSLRISSSFIIVGSLWCSRPSICFRTSCGEICAVHFLPAVCFFPVRKRVSLPFFLWALRSFALLFEWPPILT